MRGGGGFTFHRGDVRSQVDWALANKHAIELIEEFKIVENIPKISDHQPISLKIVIDDKPTISVTLSSAFQLNEIPNNHSKLPRINEENTNVELMKNVMIDKLNNRNGIVGNETSTEIAKNLQNDIYAASKIARKMLILSLDYKTSRRWTSL